MKTITNRAIAFSLGMIFAHVVIFLFNPTFAISNLVTGTVFVWGFTFANNDLVAPQKKDAR